MRQAVGWALVGTVAVVIVGGLVLADGWLQAFLILGIAGVLAFVLVLGLILVTE